MMTRKQYIETGGPESHRAYYAQFVTPGVTAAVKRCIGVENLRTCRDPHFNEIRLAEWDAVLPIFPAEVVSRMKACGDYPTNAGAVCIAKEAARQIVEAL